MVLGDAKYSMVHVIVILRIVLVALNLLDNHAVMKCSMKGSVADSLHKAQ